MGLINNTSLNEVLDYLAQWYLRAIGTATDTYGLGSNGVGVAAANLLTTFDALNNIDAAQVLVGPINTLQNSPINSVVLAQLGPCGAALVTNLLKFGASGGSSLDAYLTYMNVGVGGTWQTLQNPAWLALYPILFSGLTPTNWNLFFEILQGATYTNGLGSNSYSGSFTAGTAVPAGYVGGFPAVLSTGVSGSGTITVTGTAFDPVAKTATAGKTWTATVSSNTTTALTPGGATPAPANSLITACSGLSLGIGFTAGTFYAEAQRPSGRPLLP